MARCRCTTGSCTCKILAGPNVMVVGDGSEETPFIVSAGASAQGMVAFVDTDEVEFEVEGQGIANDPYLIRATLPWIDANAGTGGEVLTKQADGTWAPGPPVTAPIGSITVAPALAGDGTAGNPLRTAIIVGPGIVGDGTAADPIRVCLASYDELKAAVNC